MVFVLFKYKNISCIHKRFLCLQYEGEESAALLRKALVRLCGAYSRIVFSRECVNVHHTLLVLVRVISF
jgi:hypothetical protein